jgi:Zn-dependent peptidase ImmA (M78 family)
MPKIMAVPLTREKIKQSAMEYLARAHPTGSIPIPIEDIIDVYEKIDIVPMESLRIDGHEAFTARDRKTVYVDRGVYRHKNPNRYRFTLAHEFSHILLHRYVFDAAEYDDIAGFKQFRSSIGEYALKIIEKQAYEHAGYLLVPSADLSNAYSRVAEELAQGGYDIQTVPPQVIKSIAKVIGGRFGVSSEVIHRCAVRDGLWGWDDYPD